MITGSQGPGEQHGSAKLSDAQVRALLRRYARGESQKTLGVLFGISKGQVSKICHGKAWAHMHGPVPAQDDGSMPGGGDTVFGVPSRHGRENFPPASGTDTPLVASGEPNESDSSGKRHNDGPVCDP